MLRRDINLLYSLTQATKKKSSSNLMLVLVVGVVLIVGLMTFLFVNAKMTVEKNQAVVDDLDSKLSQTNTLSALRKKYDELKKAYSNDVSEVIAELAPQQYAIAGVKMSETLLDVLMLTDDEGTPVFIDVEITQILISSSSISLACAVTDYNSAWDFVDYLAGNHANIDSSLTAMTIGGKTFEELTEQNAMYFADVESNYSGLPTKSENGEPMEFSLYFSVRWEAFA